MRAEDTCL